jgi:hypothetical protein
VNLTASNAAGGNRSVKAGYVTVTSSGYPDRYVFVETGTSGESCVKPDANEFRAALFGSDSHGWQDASTPGGNPIYYPDARVEHWAYGTSTNYLDKADFAYFHGHGWNNQVYFENIEGNHALTPDIARWGYEQGSRIKWIAFHSCATINVTSWTQWVQSFNGLHAILGYNTSAPCESNPSTGKVFAQLMRGDYPDTTADPLPIIEAWKQANWITSDEQKYDARAIYVAECVDDYLPGFGPNTTPVRNGGNYNVVYSPWQMVAESYATTQNTLQKTEKIEKTAGLYDLKAMVVSIPEKIIIYTPVKQNIPKEKVYKLFRDLGISERSILRKSEIEIENTNPEEKILSIQKSAGVIIYSDTKYAKNTLHKNTRQNTPTNYQAVKTATDFLTSSGLMRKDVVIDGANPSQTRGLVGLSSHAIGNSLPVFFHRELDGIRIQNSQTIVDVGANNEIISVFVNWRDYKPYKEVSTKSVDIAFDEFTKKSLKFQMKEKPEKVVVTDLSLVYYSQKPAAAANEKFLQPVFVFEGYVQKGDVIESFEPVYITATTEQFDRIPGCFEGVCN